MRFEFSTAARIIFGPGACAEVPSLAHALGQKAFIFTDSPARASGLIAGLSEQGISTSILKINHEPDIDSVLMAMRIFIAWFLGNHFASSYVSP